MTGKEQLAHLTQVNIDDIFRGFGFSNLRFGRSILRTAFTPVFRRPARRFAQQVKTYDDLVGTDGLRTAGAWMAEALDNTVTATGIENIPTKGPVVILSNHPGMTDTMALFSQIPRDDLKILADQREFLTLLHNTSHNLLYIELEKDAVANLGKVRALIKHLKKGGAILTFPAGTIEPDPAVATGALDSLNHWSDSIDLFTRLVPNCVVIPTLISGVISPRARNHPLTKLRKNPEDQDFLAAILQVMIPSYRRVNVHIAFGKPITANKKTAVSTQVKTAMQNLIRQIINR